MTLVGIIFGSLIGVAIVCVIIAFVIRHMRKKRRRLDGFDSAKFRRSAVVLNEKDQEPDFRPRPPTMIERRQGTPVPPSGGPTSFPPPPTMAYPYSDHVRSAPMPLHRVLCMVLQTHNMAPSLHRLHRLPRQTCTVLSRVLMVVSQPRVPLGRSTTRQDTALLLFQVPMRQVLMPPTVLFQTRDTHIIINNNNNKDTRNIQI
ncbi:hypothetical protein CPB84DRAFT_863828 [Gymnopilus junonius]|uniref:Uncharacterized protein n=1 Tax=Gymnopilus junonius TaxID=109634 RepID=A0A9P5TNA2_GYMJU|nr:hypothetical protein CPB84DRAFT_863828 [Gymnopilus junonius]